MPRDHMLGYPPTAREDFEEPCWWERLNPYPFGVPNRVQDAWGDSEATYGCSTRPAPHVTAASSPCMTRGDVLGLQAMEQPQAAVPEPSESGWLVTVGRGCIDEPAFTQDPPTISEAARWPFAQAGAMSADEIMRLYVRQQERTRLEKLKAAEHEQWLARQQALGHDIIGGKEHGHG